MAAGVLLVTPRLVCNDRHATGHGFDFAGAATLTAGITTAVYALLEANRSGWSSTVTLSLFMVAAVLLATFTTIERSAKAPLVPLEAFHRGPRTASVQMVFFVSAAYAMFLLLTLYMQLVLRWSPLHTRPGVPALRPLHVGRYRCLLAARAPRRRTIGQHRRHGPGRRRVLVLRRDFASSGYTSHVLPGLVLVALGAGLGYVAVTVLGVSDARQNNAGLASGIITTAQQVGGALGLAALVSVATARASAFLAAGHPQCPHS